MSHDLQEVEDRIKWVRSEITTLEGELDAFMKQHIQVSLWNAPGRYNHIILEMKGTIPVSIRARSGTIANELRACLDSLASTLAERCGRTPNGVYFPVVETEDAFDTEKSVKDKIRKLAEPDRAAILAWRPFSTGKDGKPGNLLLYGLHLADVKRKHHRLVAHSTGGGLALAGGFVRELKTHACQLSQGHNLIAEVSKDSDAVFKFLPSFRYSEPNVLRGRPVIETLNEFADLAEAIVSSFKVS